MDRSKAFRLILAVLIIALLLVTFESLLKYVIILAIIALNFAFARLKKQIHLIGFSTYFYGLELVLFSTVLTGMAFGPSVGAISGPVYMVVNYIAERRFSKYFAATTIFYSIIGYLSYFLRDYNIIYVGIGLTLLYNLLVDIPVVLMGANRRTLILFNAINIAFNIIIFSALGPLFRNLL